MGRKLTAGVCVAALTLGPAAPAFAHDCTVANKPAKAGAFGEYNFATDEFTPLKKNPGTFDKPHGAFLALTDGDTISTSTFMRAPQGVLPPAREGGSQYNCDGKGIDALSVCFPE